MNYSDRGGKKLRPDSVFAIASITKIFTAVAILKLVEDGMMTLDQFVGDFIPEFKAEPFNKIKVLHLLNHTSGLIPDRIGWTILSVGLAFLMNFYVNYCIGMTAFWLVQASGIKRVFNVISSLLSGSIVPLVFFPESLQKMLFFLPFQYISYVPAMVFTGSYSLGGVTMEIPQIVGFQAVAVALMFFISEVIYRRAIIRFSSVGG